MENIPGFSDIPLVIATLSRIDLDPVPCAHPLRLRLRHLQSPALEDLPGELRLRHVLGMGDVEVINVGIAMP